MGSEETKKEMDSRSLRSKICVTILLVVTNLTTCIIFITLNKLPHNCNNMVAMDKTEDLIMKLNATQRDLITTEAELHAFRASLSTSSQISENVITELARLIDFMKKNNKMEGKPSFTLSDLYKQMPQEFVDVASEHRLPLGYSKLFDTDKVYLPMGHPCLEMKDDLAKYMSYEAGGVCPQDDILAQKMMVRGCEPLPRRRCHTPIPQGYVEPVHYPQSMWTIPSDTSVLWTPYTCKSYACLVDRKNRKAVFSDCRDCFDINGREKKRWMNNTSSNELNYSVDEVLDLKHGTIRIGLDIGGGTGTFAVRMREHNVTIVTTSMNFDGPFNNFIASRGVLPMFMTISQRFPFFDNTLDIVHSMHVLSRWVPPTVLELVLFDIYRVLRPGGIFWLDHFFCIENQLNDVYNPIFDKLKFNKLRWNVGPKLDRGVEYKEMYISALLEKPLS